MSRAIVAYLRVVKVSNRIIARWLACAGFTGAVQ